MSKRLILCCLLFLPLPLMAQQAEDASAVTEAPAVYAAGTGDAWLDRQLADINLYAARYPDAFVDELVRYTGVPQGYVESLLKDHQWQAADLYFACFWGKVTGLSYRELVRARSRYPTDDWETIVKTLTVAPENTHWRALRHAVVASYAHWDRPITLDALLKRQLGDPAKAGSATPKKKP